MPDRQLHDVIQYLRRIAARKDSDRISDDQLLDRFVTQGDEAAFELLVWRHGKMVLGVCRRLLHDSHAAEDAFQASFLVLARRASSIRKRASVGGWLYKVAYRTALKARARTIKRTRQVSPLQDEFTTEVRTDPVIEVEQRELRCVIDEEVSRLPEKYRVPFVLCCVDGRSNQEAAREIGCPLGTVESRLTRARERLRTRLSRRGIVPSIPPTVAVLSGSDALTSVPTRLVMSTAGIAKRVAAGQIAGAVSAPVAALTEGVLKAMYMTKLRIIAVILTVGLFGAGAGVSSYLGRGEQGLVNDNDNPALPQAEGRIGTTPQAAVLPRPQSPVAKADDKKAAPPKPAAAKTVEIQGSVLNPDGKPKAGAKILLLGENEKLTELGVTEVDGRFTVAVPKPAKGRLIARTEDDGIDFVSAAQLEPEKPVELRLVKDRPIRGQIITTEGKPVAGARVAVRLIHVYAKNSLDSFLIAWEKRRGNSEMPGGVKSLWPEGTATFAAATDAEGRFVLRGIGAERVVLLRFDGPGIASTERWVINREGFDSRPYNQELNNRSPGKVLWGPWTLMSGPDVSLVAEREKIIRGIVKDADTGKGVAGAKVGLVAGDEGNDIFRGLLALPLQTRADAEGRYEIRGALRAKSYLLQVARDRDTGTLGTTVRVADDLHGYQPFTANLSVKKGIIVTGRIIDKSTGKPVTGYVENAVLNGNPFAKNYPSESAGFVSLAETGKDDTFREVVIPGPVLLMGNVDWTRLPEREAEAMGYTKCKSDPRYPKYFQMRPDGDLGYFGLDGHPYAFRGNACKVVDAKPGTGVVHQDLFVERESARTVKIQDTEGRLLARVWATGLRADRNGPVRLNGDSCPVYALDTNKPRLMVFYDSSKKLAGSLRLTADEKESIVAKLGPTGSIRGRLLGADDKPLAGVAVDARYRDYEAQAIHEIIHRATQAVTDRDGSFTLDDLLPDLKFELTFRQGRRQFEREPKPDEATIQIRPGACQDLVAIKLKPVPKNAGE